MKKIGAIVLAAGRGSRMKSVDVNKVALSVNDRPLILRTIDILEQSGIEEIVVVVGFAKESVMRLLPTHIKTAVQENQLGTGDAERVGLEEISEDISDVLSVSGDDSFLYTPEIIQKMVSIHHDTNAAMTFATVNLEDPKGYGRIIRDKNKKIVKIVEELNATDEERKITEINAGCYLFNKKFLAENILRIKKNELKEEYYLTDILEIFIAERYPISSVTIPIENWCGINTPDELQFAQKTLQEYEK